MMQYFTGLVFWFFQRTTICYLIFCLWFGKRRTATYDLDHCIALEHRNYVNALIQ
uniref:Uncharacterized protein n=1 Tax=Rhizophora mucronata TaxID=61149 RepID=A0A2P2IVY6_RHIMU